MCIGGPSIKAPTPPPAAPPPTEALKQVNADVAAARDNTARRMAARLSLARTNVTGGLGLTGPVQTTNKVLLGA